ncbi:MAG: Anhydro-N-acetylmuramic acid kinase [uncultured Thermomicrobiales bacterium]|uniref:Anhydro-N-acetylmuramic acid kinase n=1 Tax=uncultured Thermomicrobiales bacterium TaxID=1645740 RepID=A0A6J4UY89_9BACT|nr:MAG: Anhydro-N-acetylmuramic acid kinase [uncultured Thermomicrobiales bacterium]
MTAGDEQHPERERLVVGLMSGTSVDAIDAALVRIAPTAGGDRRRVELIAQSATPFDPALRAAIFDLFPPNTGTIARLAQLDALLGEAFAAATLDLLAGAGIAPEAVDLIGSHGQTVYHAPHAPQSPASGAGLSSAPVTVQIGAGAIIAARTGITTIHNFRSADLALGGEGAPLVPYVDYLIFGDEESLAIQNIGGIGNVTVIARGRGAAGLFAFDTGPGNMLIDALAVAASGGARQYDDEGALAANGTVSTPLLDDALEDGYFARQPPKSTGREEFGLPYAAEFRAKGLSLGLSDADLLATATALTARTIADAYRRFILPTTPLDAVLLCGGGARNPTLRRMLVAELVPLPVGSVEERGLSADAKEAIAFAVLAYETAHGRPGTLPATTGASRPAVLGSIAPGLGFRLW